MKYVQPYGISDPDAPYVNGDPTIGRMGSIPPAAAIEHPQREVVGVIDKSGFVPVDADLLQLAKAVRSQRLNYAVDTGTADNLAVEFDPPITEYTEGLTLHVRVRETNTGPSRINAGAGTVAIRKMNGADTMPSDMPVGAVVTLVYEGSVFQLSNFGGGVATEEGDVFMVNIPYTVDLSPTPNVIVANFSPPITEIKAGDIIAVKVMNTVSGASVMHINELPAISLLPNGAGPMLQGDIMREDVVQFFHDGVNLRFMPQPEVNAPVTYMVGPSQQFATVADGLIALRRKTIGARGHVTFMLTVGVHDGRIDVSHPSGDRIAVRGTMLAAQPQPHEFAVNGASDQQRAQDAIWNLAMLRSRYGTEIRIQNIDNGSGYGWDYGVANTGPGQVTFLDMLIVGTAPPINSGSGPSFWNLGVLCPSGSAVYCYNVAVHGAQQGFYSMGSMQCHRSSACACSGSGWTIGGSYAGSSNCAMGNTQSGFYAGFCSFYDVNGHAGANGQYGYLGQTGAQSSIWYTASLINGLVDVMATSGSSTSLATPARWGTTSPPIGEVGNMGAIITSGPGGVPPPW